jgi:hypothetical protein
LSYYLSPIMGYVRIIIHLRDGDTRSGVRHFEEPIRLDEIRAQAFQLSVEALGRGAIEEVMVQDVPANDPAVVAMIVRDQVRKVGVSPSDGTHPYLKQEQRRPPR